MTALPKLTQPLLSSGPRSTDDMCCDDISNTYFRVVTKKDKNPRKGEGPFCSSTGNPICRFKLLHITPLYLITLALLSGLSSMGLTMTPKTCCDAQFGNLDHLLLQHFPWIVIVYLFSRTSISIYHDFILHNNRYQSKHMPVCKQCAASAQSYVCFKIIIIPLALGCSHTDALIV